MSTDQIQQALSFEQKLMERIKDGIGDLMTDDDLKKIVERGIEKALFDKRLVPSRNSYGSQFEQGPSLVDEIVSKHFESKVRQAVDNWLGENKEVVEKAVESAMKAGIAGCVMQTLDERFRGIFTNGIEYMKGSGMLQ